MDASINSPLKTVKVLSLKASLHPFTLLEISHFDVEAIIKDLSTRLEHVKKCAHCYSIA